MTVQQEILGETILPETMQGFAYIALYFAYGGWNVYTTMKYNPEELFVEVQHWRKSCGDTDMKILLVKFPFSVLLETKP